MKNTAKTAVVRKLNAPKKPKGTAAAPNCFVGAC